MSEERLDRAIELVERDFGDVVELLDCEVRAIEDALADRQEPRHAVAVERTSHRKTSAGGAMSRAPIAA
jgi:hypothetical protein